MLLIDTRGTRGVVEFVSDFLDLFRCTGSMFFSEICHTWSVVFRLVLGYSEGIYDFVEPRLIYVTLLLYSVYNVVTLASGFFRGNWRACIGGGHNHDGDTQNTGMYVLFPPF